MDFENLPDGWENFKLIELCDIARGGSPRPIKDFLTDSENGINWIKIGDASNSSKYIYETKEKIKPEGITKSRFVEVGDFLLSNSMSFGRPYILKTNGCIHDGWLVLKNKFGLFDQDYLYYFLSSSATYSQFNNLAKGSTVKNLNTKLVSDVKVILPPLNEQKRIVEKIDRLNTHSRRSQEALAEIPQLIEQFRQSVLAAAFRGDLTADWRKQNPDVEPASVLLERIKEERRHKWEEAELEKMRAKGQEPRNDKWKSKYKGISEHNIPSLKTNIKSWQYVFPEILSVDESYALAIGPFGSNLKVEDYRTEGVPLVFVREIRTEKFGDHSTKFITSEKSNSLKAHMVKGGDLLITKMGDPPGDTAIYPRENPDAIITADCIKWSLNPNLTSSEFLKYWLRAKPMREEILQETKGVAQQKLSLKRFKTIPIPIPPIEEQKKIIEYINTLFSYLDSLQFEFDNSQALLDQLNQSILAKAFRGELVPQDPNDEPASVLLERIRAEQQPKTPRQRQQPTQLNLDSIN